MQFKFDKFETPPVIGHTIFIGDMPYVVISLDLSAKTGYARPFTEEDNSRDPAFPPRAC